MTSRDFCFWLQGFFELTKPESMTAEQVDMVRRHLSLVFVHEIDRQKSDKVALVSKPVERISTGIEEVDSVLGGGLVPGATILITGEPGVGKTTLLLQIADQVAKGKRSVLYTSGEQSRKDIGDLASRLGVFNEQIDVIGNEGDIYKIIEEAEEKKPVMLVVDSINTTFVDDVEADVNSSRQIEAVGSYLIGYAKAENVVVLIVCHQTKNGDIAGSRLLENLVDAVVYLDNYSYDDVGEDEAVFCELSVGKNRHGPPGVKAVLELTQTGLRSPRKSKKGK